MGFDPCNYSLKIWESIETPTPKVGVHSGAWKFILSLSYTPESIKCVPRASFLSYTLANPYFGCEPKARVAIEDI